MADDSRQRRILADLSSALRRDPKIDEFDFIYCPEPVVNKSPVVLENHKLGLQTWSIKLLFNYVYTNLMKKTAAVKDLKSLHEFSSAVLLLNPECYTVWNLRKDLVIRRYIKAENDLKLATLIQTKHPKSPETFIQRRWLLLHIFPSCKTQSSPRPNQSTHHHNGSNSLHPNINGAAPHSTGRASHHHRAEELTDRHRQVVEREMEACRAAASRYPSNYNAWSHRVWVLKEIARLHKEILLKELESTKSWVKEHISDHSGFNFRYFLIKSLYDSRHPHQELLRIIHEEIVFTSDLIHSFPGHEAIWYHRRSMLIFGRENLLNTESYSNTLTTTNCMDSIPVVEGINSIDACDDMADTEPLVQGEKEWLLLKDFASSSSLPGPKTTPSTDPVDPIEYDMYERASMCMDMSVEESLAVLLYKEKLFMEVLLRRCCKADRPQMQRCLESHKRWLSHVQF